MIQEVYRVIHPGRIATPSGPDLCGDDAVVAKLNELYAYIEAVKNCTHRAHIKGERYVPIPWLEHALEIGATEMSINDEITRLREQILDREMKLQQWIGSKKNTVSFEYQKQTEACIKKYKEAIGMIHRLCNEALAGKLETKKVLSLIRGQTHRWKTSDIESDEA